MYSGYFLENGMETQLLKLLRGENIFCCYFLLKLRESERDRNFKLKRKLVQEITFNFK